MASSAPKPQRVITTAARLAAMVPSPRRYGPGANSAYLRQRTGIIAARARMVAVP